MKKIVFITLVFFFTIDSFSQSITFDADFESGNIASVTTTDSVNYVVRTREDIGGRWFYFRISGVWGRFISVRVENSDVHRPLYSYNNRDFVRFTSQESPSMNLFMKTFEQDTVFVAYYIPYNISYIKEKLDEWALNPFCSYDTIGQTDQNFPIYCMKVTDTTVPDSEKYAVWIHARTHPGETPSSYHWEGIVKTLLSGDPLIDYYLQRIKFYLIPTYNPEGVFFGRSRTNFSGVDLESNWSKPDDQTSTEVKLMKIRMAQLNSEKVFSIFLNLHSIASSSCTFYVHTAASTSNYFYRRQYQFTNLNTSDNPYFAKEDVNESSLKSIYPEGWLWNNYGDQVVALTYETPYDQYSNDEWVSNENLKFIGERTVYSIAEFLEISHPRRMLLDNNSAIISGIYHNYDAGLDFFGENYTSLSQNSSITYRKEDVPPGKYDIYGWWPASDSNSYNTRIILSYGGEEKVLEKNQKISGAQWNFLTEISFQENSEISVTLEGNNTGSVIGDAFRIVYSGLPTNLDTEESIIPATYQLFQNYPNPFNPETRIRFELSESTDVTLDIFNVSGEIITELFKGFLAPGVHEYVFNAEKSRLASGPYFYRLKVGDNYVVKVMLYLK